MISYIVVFVGGRGGRGGTPRGGQGQFNSRSNRIDFNSSGPGANKKTTFD